MIEAHVLKPLAVHTVEEIEVVGLDRPVAELADPVALELEEPPEPQVRVHQAPV